jgi:hypothetical protein
MSPTERKIISKKKKKITLKFMLLKKEYSKEEDITRKTKYK